MNNIDKKFFIISFLIHILLISFLAIFNNNNNINKHFLVYGAHSKKPSYAFFKPLKNTVKTNWHQKRLIEQKKINSLKKKKNQNKKVIKKSNPSKKKKPVKKNSPKKIKNKKSKTKIEQAKIIKKNKKDKKLKPETKVLEKEVVKEEELHFDLMKESNPALAIYQKHIQKEVERLWHPPVGVPKGTECSISFVINLAGTIEKIEIIKRSKVLIYDLSIMRIARNFKFDRCLFGKKFTIDFRQ